MTEIVPVLKLLFLLLKGAKFGKVLLTRVC